MRVLTRAYVLMSCTLTALLAANAAFAALAAWLAPEWIEEAGTDAMGAIAFLTGADPAAAQDREPAGSSAALPPADATFASGPDGGLLVGPAAQAPSPRFCAAEALRLEAWESLRNPLFDLLARPLPGEAGAMGLDARAEIVVTAPRIADRIRGLARSFEARTEAEVGLEPAALLCILTEEGAMADEQARHLLSRMDPAGAQRVMDGLSRRAPERAARLLGGAFPPAPSRLPALEGAAPSAPSRLPVRAAGRTQLDVAGKDKDGHGAP